MQSRLCLLFELGERVLQRIGLHQGPIWQRERLLWDVIITDEWLFSRIFSLRKQSHIPDR